MNKLKSFEDHLDKYRSKKGTDSRAEYDAESFAFRLGIMLKETRKSCYVTQEELAERTGTNKSYISRIETGLMICCLCLHKIIYSLENKGMILLKTT